MWALASERSIYLTRAPFTCGHMGHAFWTCFLKVAGVGMGSPRLARIIGFLGCTQWSTQSPFKCSLCEYCTVPKMQKWAKAT